MARAPRTRPVGPRAVGSRVARAARALVAPPPRRAPEPPPLPPAIPEDLVPLLRELGAALMSSGQSVVEIGDSLDAIAFAYGAAQVRTLVFPTGVFIRVETVDGGRSDFTGPRSADNLPLHQIGAVDNLVDDLVAHRVDLGASRVRLREILAMPPRFGPLVQVVGHAILTLGFGLILYPAPGAVLVYLGVGAGIGLLRAVAARWPTLGTALPVVASFLVGVLAITWFAPLVGGDTVRLLAPPLVSFLPGAVLTVAAMELTSSQVVAGASRLVYGIAQLLLLAFGIVAAVTVAGPLTNAHDITTFGRGAAWVGVLVVAIGHQFFSSPPRRTFWWLLLALYCAYAAQTLGAVLLSSQLSGFLGGLAIVPVAQLIARTRTGPPSVVTMLPAFWLLVPGALGFRSVSELATGASLGLTDLIDTGLALFSIALGVLVGTALTRDIRRVGAVVTQAVTTGGRSRARGRLRRAGASASSAAAAVSTSPASSAAAGASAAAASSGASTSAALSASGAPGSLASSASSTSSVTTGGAAGAVRSARPARPGRPTRPARFVEPPVRTAVLPIVPMPESGLRTGPISVAPMTTSPQSVPQGTVRQQDEPAGGDREPGDGPA